MAIFKGSFIFQAGDNGWTEGWYFNATSLATAVTTWATFRSKRDDCLGDWAWIKALRVAGEPADGVVDITSLAAPEGQQVAPAIRDTAWNAVLAMCRSGGSRRQMWMRGVPDRAVAFNAITGQPELNNLLNSALKAWAALAVKDPGGLLMKVKVRAGGEITPADGATPAVMNTPKEIAAIARIPDVNRVILTLGAHPFLQFQSITIKNGRRGQVPWLRGTYRVLEATPTTITIATPNDPQTPIQYLGGTTVYRNVYKYPPITSIKYGRFASRKTGRSLFVSRGRQRNRV